MNQAVLALALSLSKIPAFACFLRFSHVVSACLRALSISSRTPFSSSSMILVFRYLPSGTSLWGYCNDSLPFRSDPLRLWGLVFGRGALPFLRPAATQFAGL